MPPLIPVDEVNDARAVQQRVKEFVSDDYRFEYEVRFLCGERQTAGMKHYARETRKGRSHLR
jgi:3'-phosphoadenosine 5'-phosphosulfate sulfotransferase